MVFVLDNYDSFTYNLVQYLGELGATMVVRRNDQVTMNDVAQMKPSHIVISPGPGRPEDAGVTGELIRRFGPTVPTLGVCLGHQAIGMVYGGRVVRAPVPVHGKTSVIEHDGRGVFTGITNPLGLGFEAQAMVGVRTTGAPEPVADEIAKWDEADYVVVTAGQFDLLVELVCADRRQLLDLTNRIRALDGVISTESFLYLELCKQLYDWGTRANSGAVAAGVG